MAAAESKPSSDASVPERHRTPQIYTLEVTGLLIIALLILALTIVHHWHTIPWSAR